MHLSRLPAVSGSAADHGSTDLMGTRPNHEAPDYRYGQWAGNKKGYPQDPQRCVYEVMQPHSYMFAQCNRKRGHGYDGLYCKQHAKKHPSSI